MQFKVYDEGGDVRVVIDTAQDISSLLDLEAELLKVIDENAKKTFVLDLMHIKHLGSSGIGLLTTLIRKLEEGKRRLCLVNTSDIVREMLDFTEITEFIDFKT